jgi:hypothetical protein
MPVRDPAPTARFSDSSVTTRLDPTPRTRSSARCSHEHFAGLDPAEIVVARLRRDGVEAMTDATTEQLLAEFEITGMRADTRPSTRTEYRRMAEHFGVFLEQFGRTPLTAKRKYVQSFAAHLQRDDAAVERITKGCEALRVTTAGR